MKKIFLILLIILNPLQTLAFEDYIILSERNVDAVYSKDESIVSVLPFFTIDNSKNTLILKVKSEGNTTVVLETEEGVLSIDVSVEDNKTTLSEVEGVYSFPIDFMSEPEKPVLREKNGTDIN